LKLLLLFPDLLNFLLVTFNQVLWVYPFLFEFLLLFFLLFLGGGGWFGLSFGLLLLAESESLKLNVEHLDGAEATVCKHWMEQVGVAQGELPDDAFEQVQQST
jgi:hypothetical protein